MFELLFAIRVTYLTTSLLGLGLSVYCLSESRADERVLVRTGVNGDLLAMARGHVWRDRLRTFVLFQFLILSVVNIVSYLMFPMPNPSTITVVTAALVAAIAITVTVATWCDYRDRVRVRTRLERRADSH